jgi:hypothetical protein
MLPPLGYAGPVLVGEDLMAIDLAAGSVSWNGAVIGLGGLSTRL